MDADTKVALYDMNTDYFYSALTDFKTEAKQTDTNVGEGASNIPAGGKVNFLADCGRLQSGTVEKQHLGQNDQS